MAPRVDPFEPGLIEAISRIIGEAFTGSVISRMLAAVGLHDPIELSTKWRRIDAALMSAQASTGSGTPVGIEQLATGQHGLTLTNMSSTPTNSVNSSKDR